MRSKTEYQAGALRRSRRLRGVFIVLLGAAASLNAGCTGINIYQSVYGGQANTNPAPEYSHLYIIYRGGGVYHNNNTAGQVAHNVKAEGRGEGCAYSVLGLVAFGDAGIEAARRDGGLDRVHTVEYQNLAILGFLFHSHCTIVTGSRTPGSGGSENGPRRPTIGESVTEDSNAK